MQRYKLIIEYDGTGLLGWQRQEDGPSVQEHLETAFYAFTGEAAVFYASGRTDAGVHARGQVVHVDLAKPMHPHRIVGACNVHLRPAAIVVVDAEEVGMEFHARFSSKARRYLYRVVNRQSPPVIDANRVWHVKRQLDIEAMQQAAKLLEGEHDFTSFRATECQSKSPIKTLDSIVIERISTEEIHFYFYARSFLHHQVRNIVGTLVEIGYGKRQVDDIPILLEARNRALAGQTAPAHGLYFMGVEY